MKIFRFILLFLPGFLCPLSMLSQSALIKGLAPGYAGTEIVFSRFTDYITNTEKEAGKARVDNDGYFEIEIDISDITYVFSSIGIYKAYLFVEPSLTHEIELPERKDKTTNEKINPFFEETFVHIAVLNENEDGLNRQIAIFDEEYEELFANVVQGLVDINPAGTLDSLILLIENKYKDELHHNFFGAYRRYRYGFLQHVSMQQKSRSISNELFLNQPVLYNNPAYMELFNQLYNRYFLFFGRTKEGKQIYDDIGKRHSLTSLKKTLSSDDVLKEENLLEFVILKGLHDGFYTADFSRKDLLFILDSIPIVTRNESHSEIAGLIRSKVTKLMVGYEPPAIQLTDREGNVKTLADFSGKYVYLNFCTPASYSCLSEFETLKWLQGKHSDYLEIVTILVDENLESMQAFLKIRPYVWPFLFYGDQPRILKEYDVRTFPAYYLLDRTGKLILSPAPSPSENFENSLFRIMRAKREL
jgi:hypothetical protein